MPKFRQLRNFFGLGVISKTLGLLLILVLTASSVLGIGCAKTADTTGVAPLSTTFPMTVSDDLGRTITIDKAPQRIVSLAPSNTEILFDLGLGDRVVGDTLYCDYPEAAKSKPKIGGYSDIDIEKVVSLTPDLILAEDIHKAEVIPALERLGFKVYALVPHNLTEITDSVSTIGRLTGTSKEAKSIVADMQKRIKAITDKTLNLTDAQKPRVLYVLWQEPLMSSGTDTPIYEMITKAGGNSIVQTQTGFPTLSLESVIDANPQVVICNVDYAFPGGDAPLVFVQTEPRLKTIAARVSGKVFGINASLTNRPVPRIIQGFEWMAAMIHPELFPQFVTKYMGTTTTSK
ncbi:MAG: cobalamin-binding protein [Dehalococcoidia bacterium]|nr:MAG: cobalamin-binding protein [Dehalococcoidia bacterium]